MTLARIKHAQFLYYEEVGTKTHKRTGEEIPMLATRFGRRGQVVDVPRDEDFQRGLKLGAIEELPEAEADEVESDEAESEESDDDSEGEGDDLGSHEELVLWIRNERPTASRVVTAAGNDPEKAKKLMEAENEASGGQPRKSVMDPLRRIAGE